MYSNFAVGYIAALIEHLSGKAFQDFCRDELFEPLGMDNTAWLREDLPNGVLESQPVEYWGGRNPFEDVGHYCFIDYASGSLRTTAKDMAIFLDSMLDYGAPTLWPEETGQTAVRCAEEGSNANNCEFGINWILLKKNKAENWLNPAMSFDWTDAVMHDGAEVGTQTQVLLFPQEGVYAVVFTNTDGNNEWAAQRMMKEVLLKAPTLDPPSTNAPVAGPTKAPSGVSTPSPTTDNSCVDSPTAIVLKRNGSRRCLDLKNKQCRNSRNSKHCPVTCDKCGKFQCVDSPFQFWLEDGKKLSCRRLKNMSRTQRQKMCLEKEVKETCRQTCKYCDA